MHVTGLGRGGAEYDTLWLVERCSIALLTNHSKQLESPPQTVKYKKSWSVSSLHKSSRISIISDQIWLWTQVKMNSLNPTMDISAEQEEPKELGMLLILSPFPVVCISVISHVPFFRLDKDHFCCARLFISKISTEWSNQLYYLMQLYILPFWII